MLRGAGRMRGVGARPVGGWGGARSAGPQRCPQFLPARVELALGELLVALKSPNSRELPEPSGRTE